MLTNDSKTTDGRSYLTQGWFSISPNYESIGVQNHRNTKPIQISHHITIFHHHQVSTHQQEHKTDTFFDQHSLVHATSLAAFQLFHPVIFLSLPTILRQVIFGLRLALNPSSVQPNAVKQEFLLSPPSTCLNPVPPSSSYHTAYFIHICHVTHSSVCHSLLPSDLHWHWKLFSVHLSAFLISRVSQPAAGLIKLNSWIGLSWFFFLFLWLLTTSLVSGKHCEALAVGSQYLYCLHLPYLQYM